MLEALRHYVLDECLATRHRHGHFSSSEVVFQIVITTHVWSIHYTHKLNEWESGRLEYIAHPVRRDN